MATTTAMTRSGDRDARDANTVASTPARGCRPSFRLNQRRVRRRRRSSRQDVAVQRVEGPTPARSRALRHHRACTQGIAQARPGRARSLRGGIAHLLANSRSLGVPLLGLLDGVGRDTTGPGVLLEALDELGLRSQEVPEQLAGYLNGRLALVGLLDGRAMFLDIVAHRQ